MRLISINDARLDEGTETYRPDSVQHAVYLHSRMWHYNDPISPRAHIATYLGDDTAFIDVGLFGPDEWVAEETLRLGEATKVVVFEGEDEVEWVAMTPEDEIVQVLVRARGRFEAREPIEQVVLTIRSVESWNEAFGGLSDGEDPKEWPNALEQDLDGESYLLGFEESDRYAEHGLPTRILETGVGHLVDTRANYMFTIVICQRVNHPNEVVDISQEVFVRHGMEPLFAPEDELFGGFDTVAAESQSVPRSRRKRRRRLGDLRPGRRRRKRMV